MKIVKRAISLLTVFLLLATITFAEENISLKSIENNSDTTIKETGLISNNDNSNFIVKVTKVTGDKESVIHEGVLGEYDDDIWAVNDLKNNECLVIFDWGSEENEVIYVTPVVKPNSGNISTSTETANTNNFNSTKDENEEPPISIENTQLIEYDVTYSIISGDNLSIAIDYNVYNGSSADDTVSLIAALYENDRLSSVKAQSLSVDALENNTGDIILPLPNNRENYTIKLMVWEGLDGLRPIGDAKQIVDLDNYTREKYMYITSNANEGFNVYMNATTVKGANNDAVHKLKYDSSKISPVDLCGFTYNKELTPGEVENTNIIIQNADLLTGGIDYKFNLKAGRNTGMANLVKFKTLTDLTDEVIVYTIQ